ncbi:hypothetical protein BASA60_008972 [Batrachochytrium salamandrivorans]|nr:hypothetical protein BASA60_008972 [Batrachochytrium salamandrivorans]
MSFGKDLWDQVAIIETYADHGVQFMEKINDFMKQVSTIHAEEARSILKVVKQHKDEIARKSNDKTNATFNKAVLGSTLAQSWQLILTETETTANYKLEICDKIDTEIRKNIKHQGKDNEKMNKQLKQRWIRKLLQLTMLALLISQCMIQSNVVKNQHFTEILPSILDNIQTADDENKTAFCKSSLQGYVEFKYICHAPRLKNPISS